MNSKSKWVTTSYISITRPKYLVNLVHPSVPEFWHLSLHVWNSTLLVAHQLSPPFRYSFDARIFPRSRFLDKLGLNSKDCPLQILAAAEDRWRFWMQFVGHVKVSKLIQNPKCRKSHVTQPIWQPMHLTLWWTNIAMENHHAINGNIHYFYGHF